MDKELTDLLEQCIDVKGRDVVADTLSALLRSGDATEATLTIIANAGVHPIPDAYLRGDVYSASYGNWNVSSQGAVEAEFKRILGELGRKLTERQWKRIYLILTGHPALAIQIK